MSEPTSQQEWALLTRLSRTETVGTGDMAAAIKLQARGLIELRLSLDGTILGATLTEAGQGLARLRRAMLA